MGIILFFKISLSKHDLVRDILCALKEGYIRASEGESLAHKAIVRLEVFRHRETEKEDRVEFFLSSASY